MKLSHGRKQPFLLVCALAAVAVGGGIAAGRLRKTDASDQIQYKVTRVLRGEVRKTVSASGTLQAWNTVDIKSKAGGRVSYNPSKIGL